MYEQQLPGYITAFKTAPWEVRESAHYRFHFFKESLAEKEIAGIEKTQEQTYTDILAFLTVPSPRQKISYYFYPDASKKEQLMGSPWFAQSIYNEFEIHALYCTEHRVIGPHEDTHLLALPLGVSIGFLQEGLAERMVGHDWFGNGFDQAVREALEKKEITPSPTLLIQHQAWLDTDDAYARQYYAFAALFSNYLIQNYGKDNYFRLYSILKREVSPEVNQRQYKELLGIAAEEIFNQFLSSVR